MELDDLQTDRDSDGFIILKRTYSDLHSRRSYLSPVKHVVNRIYEYDIKSANTSTLRASGKMDESVLDMLDELDKDGREVAIGKIIAKRPDVYKIISKGIARAREDLFAANQVQDHEVLSIHNDAVLIIGRKLKVTKFGPVEFKCKNQYAAYIQLDKIEIYYDKQHRRIDIKGIKDSVLEEPDHQNGMLEFLRRVFSYLVYDQRDDLRKYLIEFAHDYKAKQLPHQYYREMNSDNCYRTIVELAGFNFNLLEISDDDLEMINPVYNYKRFVLPIIQQYM